MQTTSEPNKKSKQTGQNKARTTTTTRSNKPTNQASRQTSSQRLAGRQTDRQTDKQTGAQTTINKPTNYRPINLQPTNQVMLTWLTLSSCSACSSPSQTTSLKAGRHGIVALRVPLLTEPVLSRETTFWGFFLQDEPNITKYLVRLQTMPIHAFNLHLRARCLPGFP